jgi:hypothetical protein
MHDLDFQAENGTIQSSPFVRDPLMTRFSGAPASHNEHSVSLGEDFKWQLQQEPDGKVIIRF